MARIFPTQQKPAENNEENLVDQILEDVSPAENCIVSTDVLDGIGNVDVKVEAEDCFKDVTMTGVDLKSELAGKSCMKDDIMDLMKVAVGNIENVAPKAEDGKDNLLVKTIGFITCSECSLFEEQGGNERAREEHSQRGSQVLSMLELQLILSYLVQFKVPVLQLRLQVLLQVQRGVSSDGIPRWRRL